MATDYCYWAVCFAPLEASGPVFFGFSEFLTGLALMVLAWTIADVRYRFRIRTAPLPLQNITFAAILIVGILTLMTDLWQAQHWLVPQGNLFSTALWRACLGALFLLTFFIWVWFAFIKPPTYGRMNAERYARTLYKIILKGSPSELSIVSDELTGSAKSLVHFATDRGKFKNFGEEGERDSHRLKKTAMVTCYANDVLLLIADKRFCRVLVQSSPGTALAIFQEMVKTKKYGIQVDIFARNIVNEALANRDSFLFHETEGYESGLIGYYKPLSQAMFSNYDMVEAVGTLLDPDIREQVEWNSFQWEAYCRAVLITLRSYVAQDFWDHSYVLYRAMGYIEYSVADLYKLNGLADRAWNDDTLAKLRVTVKFIKNAVEVLDDNCPDQPHFRGRNRSDHNIFDQIADMIFEVIFHVSAIRSPGDLCWLVHHNSVWSELFNFSSLDSRAGKIVKFKVRRLIYDEIAKMNSFPNFKGAKILGFCLNVMGLTLTNQNHDLDSKALHKVVLSWTKSNYLWLRSYNPSIAEACLVEGITFEAEHARLVKTYPAEGLRREPFFVYLKLTPPSIIP